MSARDGHPGTSSYAGAKGEQRPKRPRDAQLFPRKRRLHVVETRRQTQLSFGALNQTRTPLCSPSLLSVRQLSITHHLTLPCLLLISCLRKHPPTHTLHLDFDPDPEPNVLLVFAPTSLDSSTPNPTLLSTPSCPLSSLPFLLPPKWCTSLSSTAKSPHRRTARRLPCPSSPPPSRPPRRRRRPPCRHRARLLRQPRRRRRRPLTMSFRQQLVRRLCLRRRACC